MALALVSSAAAVAAAPAAPATPIARTAPSAPSASSAAAGALGVAPAGALGDERVEIELPSRIVFEVTDLADGPVGASSPSRIVFHGAHLTPGKVLQVAVRLDTPLPDGATIAFGGRDPRGGSCAAASVSAAGFTKVFVATAGAAAGGCELSWTLSCGNRVRRAGRYELTLRWRIDSAVGSDATALAAAARAGLPPSPQSPPSPTALVPAKLPSPSLPAALPLPLGAPRAPFGSAVKGAPTSLPWVQQPQAPP